MGHCWPIALLVPESLGHAACAVQGIPLAACLGAVPSPSALAVHHVRLQVRGSLHPKRYNWSY